MHRERWQFIRVPRIVDTYYHAKYNMLTTSHNAAPRSSRFFPVRPFGESRFRAQKILLPPFGRCTVGDTISSRSFRRWEYFQTYSCKRAVKSHGRANDLIFIDLQCFLYSQCCDEHPSAVKELLDLERTPL